MSRIPFAVVTALLITAPAAKPAEPDRKLNLVDGKFGKSLDARATPTSVAGHDRFRTPPLTVECWAHLRGRDHFNVLVSCDPKNSARHWEIYSYAGSGAFSAYLPGYEPAEIKSTRNIVDEQWHHVAMTFDGTTVRLYVDGKLAKEQAVKPRDGVKPADGRLYFGQAVAPDHRVGCDGQIDDVRISSVVREISAVPAAEVPQDPSTVGLWRFDRDEGLKGDPAWTPPPVLEGKAEPWEKMTDADWIDPRFRSMDTGPFLGATFAYPAWTGTARAFKGIAIRVGEMGEAAVIFDRNQLRLACGWTGGWLNHSDRRFGLLNTPSPAGTVAFATASQPGWAYPREAVAIPATTATAPLPREWGKYLGLYRHGKRTVIAYRVGDADVLESPWVETSGDLALLTRTLEVGASGILRTLAGEFPAEPREVVVERQKLLAARHNGVWHFVAVAGNEVGVKLVVSGKRIEAVFPASKQVRRCKLVMGSTRAETLAVVARAIGQSPPAAELTPWKKPGPVLWKHAIQTRLERGGNDAPLVIDTLALPYENPYKALFFVTGVDFLPDGRVAICTAHGDVWLAKVDEKAGTVAWQRFATGLYQPLGLRVVDGKIVVTERGQLSRLHDANNDGEADFIENLNNDWHCGGGEHSYDTCLETDPEGNFYLFKTGDDQTPTGGCLLKIAADGSKSEIFSTGFRHPIGMGMSATGMLTGADQEGNWMPATRIDAYRKGGFYGDMRTHHRAAPPKTYDPPMLWLPREADNSAGGQVWVPEGKWGPLSGRMLHLSYGRCRMLVVMPQQSGDLWQAGAVNTGLTFLSGVKTGRFHPNDGNLYVAGLNGWQTAAQRDGCLQRVRYTGKPLRLPVAMTVERDAIRIAFSEPIDPKSAADLKAWKIEQWNYRWSGEYGSRHWSVANPSREGHDPVSVDAIVVSDDRKGVQLKIPGLQPVMQMKIGYSLRDRDGSRLEGAIFNTINFAK